MRIVADSKIPFVQEALADVAEVHVLATGEITPETVRNADALLVRSETNVDAALLDGSRVKFVGTATIGVDHIDTDYLQRRGIGFASAPGCNANSVAEYVIAALLVLAERLGFSLEGKALGVVGVGNIGKIVVKYAHALGMCVLQNDPPLHRATGSLVFRPLDELMDADIITLHVPLTKTGPDRTFHLFDDVRLKKMKPSSILLNTSRGAVVETEAVKAALRSSHLKACVLDVWENEPGIDAELLSLATLGTPHIAGYSFDGKVNGTAMIQQALCQYFSLQPAWSPATVSGSPIIARDGQDLLAVVRQCYDIEDDDRRLREMLLLPVGERSSYFRQLRAQYPVRHEFGNNIVDLHDRAHRDVLRALGFQVADPQD